MIVMAFDLSSACIGVITARLAGNGEIERIMSCPILPARFNPETLGYLKTKKKVPTGKKSQEVNAWIKPGEEKISIEEKKRRDTQVRSAKDIYILEDIGKRIAGLVDNIQPDIILVEKNAIFNGILTSILLAKVMGILLGIAGRLSIPVTEYSVTTVRKIYSVAKLVQEFASRHTPEELKSIPDITKRALRELMVQKYASKGIAFQTDDESDACVVFDYWYVEVYKRG